MRGLVFAALVAAGAYAAPAHAQAQHDPAAADELFERAKELLRQGEWGQACPKLEASMELDPAVGTLLKLAKCAEHDHKLALALHDYQAALTLNRDKPDETEARRAELDAFARAALAELEPRVPKLRIEVDGAPPGLRVTRGGEEIPAAALGEALPVNPGDVEVVATAPGYLAEHRSLTVEEGKSVTLSLTLRKTPALAPMPAPTTATAPVAAPPLSARRVGAYVAGGTGLAALATAGGFAIDTIVQANKVSGACPGDVCRGTQEASTGRGDVSAAQTAQTTALVLLAAGVVLGTVAPLLYFSGGNKQEAVSVGLQRAGLGGSW